jgi:hypothetical protein
LKQIFVRLIKPPIGHSLLGKHCAFALPGIPQHVSAGRKVIFNGCAGQKFLPHGPAGIGLSNPTGATQPAKHDSKRAIQWVETFQSQRMQGARSC